jgi:hypothetical protein
MFVPFARLTRLQRIEARELRPKWKHDEFIRFSFWICKDGHISKRLGHHELTEVAWRGAMQRLSGEADRSKGDLRDWKPGTTFHFDNSHKPIGAKK